MTSQAQQITLDNELVATENCRAIGKCNMRINPGMKPEEPTYQVALDALSLTTCYLAFLITAEVHVIYMHQFWATVTKHKIQGQDFDEPPTEEEALSFICELGHSGEIRDDSVLGTMRFVSIHANTQVYGAIVPKAMTNQVLLDSVAYKTYYAIASGAEPPMSRKSKKKSDSAISSEESPSKKKSTKAKKVAATKPKPTKKKAPEATKRSKKDFHISQASGSGDGTDFGSGVPDEQHLKTTGIDEGTGTIPRVLDVPKYDFESEKESWCDSGEEDDDDENNSEEESDNDDYNDDDDSNNDDNDGDNDTNDDEEETDSDRTKSDRIKIPVLNQSTTEYYKEEENINDEETMNEEEDDEVIKELYSDVNVNLGNRDTDVSANITIFKLNKSFSFNNDKQVTCNT
ncbi:hypothetical protein Tco_0499799 [Tanacetum coccineum]